MIQINKYLTHTDERAKFIDSQTLYNEKIIKYSCKDADMK